MHASLYPCYARAYHRYSQSAASLAKDSVACETTPVPSSARRRRVGEAFAVAAHRPLVRVIVWGAYPNHTWYPSVASPPMMLTMPHTMPAVT